MANGFQIWNKTVVSNCYKQHLCASAKYVTPFLYRYTGWMVLDPDAKPAEDLDLVTGLHIEVTGDEGCGANLYPYDGMDEHCKYGSLTF